MYRLIFLLCILFSFSNGYAQQGKQKHEAIRISDILPFYDYERIREYVFAEGDRKDYCKDYLQLPHLAINNLDTELYFVNYPVKKNPEIDDYSIMYFVTGFNGKPVNFYIYMADNAKVYLYDYHDLFKDAGLKKKALSELQQKVSAILNKIDSNN